MARLKPLRWLLAVVLPVVVGLAVIAGAYSATAIRRRLAEVDASERRSFKAVRGRLDESFDGVLDFAYLTCGFGGGELDLSKATIEDSPATLDVAAYMGGGQIRIPGTWRIRNETTAIAGGIQDSRASRSRGPDSPELVVQGQLVMGGFDIAD